MLIACDPPKRTVKVINVPVKFLIQSLDQIMVIKRNNIDDIPDIVNLRTVEQTEFNK